MEILEKVLSVTIQVITLGGFLYGIFNRILTKRFDSLEKSFEEKTKRIEENAIGETERVKIDLENFSFKLEEEKDGVTEQIKQLRVEVGKCVAQSFCEQRMKYENKIMEMLTTSIKETLNILDSKFDKGFEAMSIKVEVLAKEIGRISK